jgi:hypothetical protein
MRKHTLRSICVFSLISVFSAFANDTDQPQKPTNKNLEPATRYSGRAPIDLTNGVAFNNGTYGRRNANYEKWAAAPTVAPGVSDLTYPYTERNDFINGCEENARFVENAMFNWRGPVTVNTNPAAKEYRDQAAKTMQPLLDRFMETLRAAKSAGKNDWEKAQSDARHALTELRANYTNMHKNVH